MKKFDYRTITSYELACAALGRDPEARPDYSKCGYTPAQERYHMCGHELDIFNEAINRDEDGNPWTPTPDDRRYSAWGLIEEDESTVSGFGVSFDGSGYGSSDTDVPSRLQYRDAARAEFAMEAMPKHFEAVLVPQFGR